AARREIQGSRSAGLIHNRRNMVRARHATPEQGGPEPFSESGDRSLDGLAGNILPGHALAETYGAVIEREPHVDVGGRTSLRQRMSKGEVKRQLRREDLDPRYDGS